MFIKELIKLGFKKCEGMPEAFDYYFKKHDLTIQYLVKKNKFLLLESEIELKNIHTLKNITDLIELLT